MSIRVLRFALAVATAVVSAHPGPAEAGVPASDRGAVTGSTCRTGQTTFERIKEVAFLVDGQEFARIDDPEKTSRLANGATFCLDTAQVPNGDHRVEFVFTAEEGRVERAATSLTTDNPPFRLNGVFPDKPFYRSGQTIEMSLETTHSGLAVAVDFSRIDSRYRAGDETVVPLSEGRYLVRYTLSRNNSRAVGLYPVSIRLSQAGKSRLYSDGINLGFLPRRDSPLSLSTDGRETQIFASMPHATGSPLRIVSLQSSAVEPVKIGETVRISGVVAAPGPGERGSGSPGRAVTVFFSEMSSDGFYRAPVELTPCSGGPPGCVGRFSVDLELTAAGAEPLGGLETQNLRFSLEDARGGVSAPAHIPVPALPVRGEGNPPPGPFRVSGNFQYRAPNPIFHQSGPNDINLVTAYMVDHPVRFANVRVVRDSDGATLGFTRTNKFGDYGIDFNSPLGGFVHVSAFTEVDTLSRKIRVYDSHTEIYTLTTGSWVPQFEPDKHVSAISSQAQWLIFDNMARGIDFVSDFAGKSLPRINVLWEHGYAQGRPNSNYVGGRSCTLTSYYSRDEVPGGQLHLTSKLPNFYPHTEDVEDEDTGMHMCVPDGQFLAGDLDDFDSPVQVHEFGHFLQHYVTRAGGCTHGPAEPKSAWCEGSPTAIGQTVLGSPFYYDQTVGGNISVAYGAQNVDQNTGTTNNQASMPVCGPYSDGWVWRLLYDFFDPKSSSISDVVWAWAPEISSAAPEPVTVSAEGVHFGNNFDRIGNIKAVMDVLAQYMSVDDPTPPDRGPEGAEFVDFLDGWIAQGNGQQLDILTLAFDVMTLNYDFGFLGDNLCQQGLVGVVDAFILGGDVPDPGVANSLRQKAAHAQAALEEGRLAEAANLLRAFQQEVAGRRGRHVSDRAAAVLGSMSLGILEEIAPREL